MATILMGWELGEGFGHLAHLLPIARALAAEGHRPVFAVRDVCEPWPLFRDEPFTVLQAPGWPARRWRGDRPFNGASLADVLALYGWGCAAGLGALVQAWQGLLDAVRPRLVVCEYSPTLCLTAYQTLPVIEVGSSLWMPPVDQPTFPVVLPEWPPLMAQEEMLAVAQEVQRRRSRPSPPTLTSILAAADRFPALLPELDPYGELRQEPVWDPLHALPPLAPPAPDRSFFAYLAEGPSTDALLTQLVLTGCRGAAYVRGLHPEGRRHLRRLGLDVLDEPAPLPQILAHHAVFVHHGGGSAATALAAGRPQLLLPQHLEQLTTARQMRRLGVGEYLLRDSSPAAAARALLRLMDEPAFAARAANRASAIHARPRREALPAILACCRRHLARSA
jgi:hypothetical protein